jgi:hypothetical protein
MKTNKMRDTLSEIAIRVVQIKAIRSKLNILRLQNIIAELINLLIKKVIS